MPGSQTSRSRLWAVVVLAIAIFYRVYLHQILVVFGLFRTVQPIEDFPWHCTQIQHPLLEGCEDIWLDTRERKLYGGCSDITTRLGWAPGGDKFNASARTGKDHISVLNIDQPGPDGLYSVRQLKIANNYQAGLDLFGFDVRKVGNRLRFWLVNMRPPVDPVTGAALDASEYGGNSTVEVFDLEPTSDTLVHVKTIASEALVAANNLAVMEDGIGFLVTNDHDSRVGTFRSLGFFFPSGSVSYCRTDTGKCQVLTDKGFSFPNGIVQGHDGLFYVAHSARGLITVHNLIKDEFVQVDKISVGLPVDNLSVDVEGNIHVAAFPDVAAFFKLQTDPENTKNAPATVLRISKNNGQYEVEKLAEDKDAKSMPTSTSVTHDVQTNRLFMGGILSRGIGICERNQ